MEHSTPDGTHGEEGCPIAIIGAGPAGLAAAEAIATLAGGRVAITIHDAMPSAGRKLLMAGRGGLNLTHSEPLDRFMARYGAARDRLAPAIDAFPPNALRAWSAGLGQETFVGSSGRVFPAAFKASPLLRAWLRRLDGLGVRLALRRRWIGWDAGGALCFETPSGPLAIRPAATVLALGGGSWPRLGSDGAWVGLLRDQGLAVEPLVPANSGFDVAWTGHMQERFAGQPLKGIAVAFGQAVVRGEAIVTRTGIEGGAIYALSGPLRAALAAAGEATLLVDLKPDVPLEALAGRLSRTRQGESLSNRLRKAAGLTPVAIALMREAAGPALPADASALAALVKGVPLRVAGVRPLERAISTAGGLSLDELDARSMLVRRPGVFAAGEMLDWEAPTGGYLLQACIATGRAAGRGVVSWLASSGRLVGEQPGP